MNNIKIDDNLKINIRKMGINGEGIGYYNQKAIFVDEALPNEEVDVIVTEIKDNYLTGKINQIIKESKDRAIPFCPIYSLCGGCQTQHIKYEAMLIQKRDHLIQAFNKYLKGAINPKIVKQTIGADNPKNYRNRAILPIRKTSNNNRFGMFQKNSNIFIPIDTCPIQNETINKVYQDTVKLLDKYKIDAFDPKSKKGFIRFLLVRIAENTQELQVSFIMYKAHQNLDKLIDELCQKYPNLNSVFEVINDNLNVHTFFTNKTYLKRENEYITEELNNQKFKIKPDAFFQLNTKQADKFYLEMRRLANLKKTEIAIDAYAGIAPVSHYIASDAKLVYAIEENKDACESAKLSLIENKINNVKIIKSSFENSLNQLKNVKIDVMLFDPPRTGLGEKTIKQILNFLPNRIVYGSCNPSTLAKDLSLLLHKYELIETVPIDMFPYTSLVESVSLLKLKIIKENLHVSSRH